MITKEEAIKITKEARVILDKEDRVFIEKFLAKTEEEIRKACERGCFEVLVDFPFEREFCDKDKVVCQISELLTSNGFGVRTITDLYSFEFLISWSYSQQKS